MQKGLLSEIRCIFHPSAQVLYTNAVLIQYRRGIHDRGEKNRHDGDLEGLRAWTWLLPSALKVDSRGLWNPEG